MSEQIKKTIRGNSSAVHALENKMKMLMLQIKSLSKIDMPAVLHNIGRINHFLAATKVCVKVAQ